MMIDSAIDTEGEDLYSEEELRKLWESFCDKPDCVQRLSDFGLCSLKAARKLDKQFRKQSAAARRAIEAEVKRRQAITTITETPVQKPTEAPQSKKRGRKPKILEAEIPDSELADLPPDALLAALVNHRHEISVIRAEASNLKRAVIVEQFNTVYRVKRVTYQFFSSYDAALEAAKKEHLKLRVF